MNPLRPRQCPQPDKTRIGALLRLRRSLPLRPPAHTESPLRSVALTLPPRRPRRCACRVLKR